MREQWNLKVSLIKDRKTELLKNNKVIKREKKIKNHYFAT